MSQPDEEAPRFGRELDRREDAPRFGGKDRPNLARIPFAIAVWSAEDPEAEPEYLTFHAVGMLNAGALLDLAALTDSSGRTSGDAMLRFFQAALVEEELDAWLATLHDTRNVVIGADLAEVARYLNERYSPNGREAPSRRDRRASTRGSSSRGTTPEDDSSAVAWG